MTKKELILIPTPGMGHLVSAVELAKLIIKRDPNISVLVLIINPPLDSSIITSYIDSLHINNPSNNSNSHRLTFLTLPPLHNPPDTSIPTFFSNLINLNKPLVKQALENRVESGSPKPTAFILDMFCTPMMDVANDIHVPSYIFFTSGAALLNLTFYLQSLVNDDGEDDMLTRLKYPDIELHVPGYKNPVPGHVIPGVFLEEMGWKIMENHAKRYKQCKGIIINTFMELESNAIQALMGHSNVYPVGPILALDKENPNRSKKKEEEIILSWLDEQPECSVVFLCFGSMGCFNEDQVKEIAIGLEKSGHRFLWSLRNPPPGGKFGMPTECENFEEVMPEGFMGRTAHLGKVIGWAPQISILAHKAVGGFVSHCGWNSTLESMWFGVPMGTWPMYAEQQLNAFTLVKELELAVEIKMEYRRDWNTGKGNMIVKGEEIEMAVKKLMNLDEKMKEKVRKTSEISKKSLEPNGSSHYWLGRFIEDVSLLDQ